MLYLYINKNQVKLLATKKSLFNQFSIGSFEKNFQVALLKKGNVSSVDVLASAIKEVLQNTPVAKDKQVFLILPQTAFLFLRIEVPNNITANAIDSFIKDKIKASFPQQTGTLFYDYFFIENDSHKYLSVFLIEEKTVVEYQQVLKLLDLHLEVVLPESLAYFKLFEKTLRKGKAENILYGKYEKDVLYTHLYDSFGLLENEKREYKITTEKAVKEALKQTGQELEKKGKKINRLILSGVNSETIRQDTFTKEVGMWTNPLKRIIPQFYQDYMKLLVTPDNKPLSLLEFDVCLGAFIFSIENKQFSPLKHTYTTDIFSGESFKRRRSLSLPSLPSKIIPKEVLLFILSFALSFGVFSLLNKSGVKLTLPRLPVEEKKTEVTPTPLPPSPTPTPAFTREELKIKILNGSGTRGKASEVRDILKESGYQEIVTGNADSFDYATTEIQVKKDKNDAITFITDDLSEYVEKPQITELDEDESADITVIIGQDFK
ncbi:MAG: LytR C-terminal domain-containing protein [Patescibacteria group bacterium]